MTRYQSLAEAMGTLKSFVEFSEEQQEADIIQCIELAA